MFLPGKNGVQYEACILSFCVSDEARTADQSEGGKTVGVDSTVITAR